MIIDAHTHIGKLPRDLHDQSYEKNLDLLLKEGQENSVDHLLILAGLEKADGFNISTKSLLKLIAGHKNAHAVAGMDIEYQNEDLVQLEEWVSARHIVGIKFYTGYQHFYPSDERCIPIYQIALQYDIPVVFHSGDTLAGYVPNPKLKYSHPLNIDDVATDFPSLKIVIAHMGNPWLIDCAELLYKHPNVFADISGLVAGSPIEKRYSDLMRQRINELIAYSSADKLIYGTDWPLAPMSEYLGFVQSLDISSKSLDRVMYKNAAELFALNI